MAVYSYCAQIECLYNCTLVQGSMVIMHVHLIIEASGYTFILQSPVYIALLHHGTRVIIICMYTHLHNV